MSKEERPSEEVAPLDGSFSSASTDVGQRHTLQVISYPLPKMAEKDAQLADEFLRQLDAKASSTVFDSPHRCSRTADRKRNHGRKRSSTTRPSSLQSLTLEVETIDEKISEARKMGLLSDPNVGKATAAGPPDVLVNLTRDRSLTTPNSANYLMTPPSLMDSPTPVLLHAKVIRFLWAWIPLGSYRLTYYPAGKFLPSSQLTPVRFSPLWGQQNDAASEGVMPNSAFSRNTSTGRQGSRSVWSRHADRLLLAVTESYPSFGIDRLTSSGAPSEFYRGEHTTFVARRRPLSLSAQTVLGVPLVSAVWAVAVTFTWPQFLSIPRAFSGSETVLIIWLVALVLWIIICTIHIFLLRPWQVTCCRGRRIVIETRWKSIATRLVELLNSPPPMPMPGKSPSPLNPLPRDDFRQWKSLISTIFVTVGFICLLVTCIMTLVMYKQCVECGGCNPSNPDGRLVYPDPACYDYYIDWIPGATTDGSGHLPTPQTRPWFPVPTSPPAQLAT